MPDSTFRYQHTQHVTEIPQRATLKQQAPFAAQEGSLEQYLVHIGMPSERVDEVVLAAVAWRVTPAGRPLIDRRRRSRVERNVQSVADYLLQDCGVRPGERDHWSLAADC